MYLHKIYELLPQDIFCYILKFIEPITPSTEAIRQNKRNDINVKIKGAISRNNSDDDSDEQWAFGFIDDDNESLQLQAVNCIECGNYILSENIIQYRTQCHCHE